MNERPCRIMLFWHDFLDSLDSDGGKILILLLLMFIGAGAFKLGLPKAEDIMVGAFGALLMTLKDAGSNKDRREGEPMPLPTSAGAPPVAVIPAPLSPAPIVAAVDEAANKVVDAIEDK